MPNGEDHYGLKAAMDKGCHELLKNLLSAWDRFPGRSCSEMQWNIWMMTMLRAVENARKAVEK